MAAISFEPYPRTLYLHTKFGLVVVDKCGSLIAVYLKHLLTIRAVECQYRGFSIILGVFSRRKNRRKEYGPVYVLHSFFRGLNI